MPLRILTFNWHEAYLHLLSKTGFEFDVVERWKAGIYGWIRAFRPVPPNCRLISEEEAKAGMQSGRYDRILAHNFSDLLLVQECSVPKVLIFHNKLSTEISLSPKTIDREEYLKRASHLLSAVQGLTLVFISEAKRLDWGLPGEVILPGIDSLDYADYRGDTPKVLRVGNGFVERDIMLGFSVQERILQGLPSMVLGLNASIPHARIPRDWDAFKAILVRHRLYLNTTLAPYEDGYNLAMLEAMVTGMPIVSIENPSSPIEDGLNGYISGNEESLRERVKTLFTDLATAKVMGKRAKETVMDRFPIHRFVNNWRTVLDGKPRKRSTHREQEKRSIKILMSYTSNPQTTAAYLEKALRRHHEVITYGPRINDDILKTWDLEKIRDRVREHDIPYFTDELTEVLYQLPKGWNPDLFLWVESGVSFPLKGFEALSCPRVCYLIDTHLHLANHLEIAGHFDHVFLAQKEYVKHFIEAGIPNVHWLPLACDPDIHQRFEVDVCHELTFVGSFTPSHRKRNALLVALSKKFPLHVERCFLEEMAFTFSRSKMVFNRSRKNDLNMRVFEALATGSLLITDEAGGSGLTELFEDGKHLVVYKHPRDLYARVEYYLKNDAERKRIASEGRREVLRHHTYENRVHAMMRHLGLVGMEGTRDARFGDAVTQGVKKHEDAIAESIGKIYRRTGDLSRAYTYFREAVTCNPENLEAMKGMLQLADGILERTELIGFLETYLKYHPADMDFLRRHAEMCYRSGRLKESLESIDKLLLFEPALEGARELRRKITGNVSTGV